MKKCSRPVLFASLFGLLLVSSCRREKEKDPITITYELGEIKDYIYFKKGTWWVYEHDITHEIDSQYVTSAAIGNTTNKGTEAWSKHITLIQEVINMRIRSNFKDGWGSVNYFDIYTSAQNVNASPYPDKAFIFEMVKTPNIIMGTSSGSVFRFPYALKTPYCAYQDTVLTNYTLNGSTYDTVRVFYIPYDDAVMQTPSIINHTTSAKCYYAKNVGIIRIYQESSRLSDGKPMVHSWNLIKKNIVQ